ncbi:uncharacterized protein LOC109832815 [Asparagus officinalis]|uniref:uncharacterized protein LOC109832815 n=1 Tax=Asparagus officinalis TaxID=4686 RepID=UPI00098E297C|nr:uncharacterized protein LOC109832815 [Asparagus officinalis]
MDRLIKRGIIQSNICSLCERDAESHTHLFFECHFSMTVWNEVMNWLKFKWRTCNWRMLLDWYCNRLRGRGFKLKVKRMALAAVVYNIWKERNNRIFNQKKRAPEQIVRDIKIGMYSVILNNPLMPNEDRDCFLSL